MLKQLAVAAFEAMMAIIGMFFPGAAFGRSCKELCSCLNWIVSDI